MTSTNHIDQTQDVPAWARERAETLQGLYIHLLVFVVVNAGLFVLNWVTRSADGDWWVQWPLMAWSIGLATHVISVFAPVFTRDWVDRRARRIAMRRQS